MIDGALAKHAGAAEDLMYQHVVIAKGCRDPIIRRSDDGRDRYAERSRKVHGAGVVRHERRAPRHHAGDEAQVGSPDQIDRSNIVRQRRFYLTPGIAVVGGLLLLSALSWLGRFVSEMRYAFSGGAASTLAFAVNVAYTVLMAALIVRVITSWLGLYEHDRRLRPVRWLTDWLVEPIRRRVPPFGMIDISPLVAWLVLMLGRAILLAIIL